MEIIDNLKKEKVISLAAPSQEYKEGLLHKLLNKVVSKGYSATYITSYPDENVDTLGDNVTTIILKQGLQADEVISKALGASYIAIDMFNEKDLNDAATQRFMLSLMAFAKEQDKTVLFLFNSDNIKVLLPDSFNIRVSKGLLGMYKIQSYQGNVNAGAITVPLKMIL